MTPLAPPDPFRPPQATAAPLAAKTPHPAPASSRPTDTECRWAALLWLSIWLGILIPVLGLIAPLAIYAFTHRNSRLMQAQGRLLLNASISWLIWAVGGAIVAGAIGAGIAALRPGALPGVTTLAVISLVVAMAANLVFTIKATIAAGRGEVYRFPLTIRFIR